MTHMPHSQTAAKTNNYTQPTLYRHYFRQVSSHQTLFFTNTPNNQSSPRQPRSASQMPGFLNAIKSPQGVQRRQFKNWGNNQNVRRNLFSPTMSNMPQKMPTLVEQQLEQTIMPPVTNRAVMPKISFSYKREDSLERSKVATMPHSCDTAKKMAIGQKVVEEFALIISNKVAKRKANLQICSKEMNHSIIPRQITKTQKKHSSLLKKQSSHSFKKNFNNSGTGYSTANEQYSKVKESKIASTEATRSFQAEIHPSEGRTSNCMKQTAFQFLFVPNNSHNRAQIKQKVSPVKLLKKTMVFSRYDFGGLFGQELVNISQGQTSNKIQKQMNPRWKSYVKCLFDGQQDLKTSIHCGPDVKREEQKCDILMGFGRQIAQSCIPQQDHTQ